MNLSTYVARLAGAHNDGRTEATVLVATTAAALGAHEGLALQHLGLLSLLLRFVALLLFLPLLGQPGSFLGLLSCQLIFLRLCSLRMSSTAALLGGVFLAPSHTHNGGTQNWARIAIVPTMR
jgi:hypothetical protein